MDVYIHGVGSSCKGNEYNHEVYHLVQNGITLCGVYINSQDWWRTYNLTINQFHVSDTSKRYRGDSIICQRCAKVKDKIIHIK